MITRRRAYLKIAAAVGVGLGVAGCSDEVEDTNLVEITDEGFDPRNIRVSLPGDMQEATVAWENVSSEEHQISSASMNWNFESQPIQPQQSVAHAFLGEGVYDVVCGSHGDPGDFEGSEERMKVAIGNDVDIEDPV